MAEACREQVLQKVAPHFSKRTCRDRGATQIPSDQKSYKVARIVAFSTNNTFPKQG